MFRQLFSSVPDSEICSINMTVETSDFWKACPHVVLCSIIKQLDLGLALIWIIVQFPENIFWKYQEDVLHVFGDIKYWITILCHLPSAISLSLAHTHSQHGLIYVSTATKRSSVLRNSQRWILTEAKISLTHMRTHTHTLTHTVCILVVWIGFPWSEGNRRQPGVTARALDPGTDGMSSDLESNQSAS